MEKVMHINCPYMNECISKSGYCHRWKEQTTSFSDGKLNMITVIYDCNKPLIKVGKIIEHTYGASIYMKLEVDGEEHEVTCYLREDGKHYKTTADGTDDREKVIAAFEELY